MASGPSTGGGGGARWGRGREWQACRRYLRVQKHQAEVRSVSCPPQVQHFGIHSQSCSGCFWCRRRRRAVIRNGWSREGFAADCFLACSPVRNTRKCTETGESESAERVLPSEGGCRQGLTRPLLGLS